MVNRSKTEVQLVLHEGLRLTPYRCTADRLTIGVGYNVQDRGWHSLELVIGRAIDRVSPSITREEALMALHSDINGYEAIVRRLLPVYDTMGEIRERVIVDMAFNMGYRALGFKKAIACIKRGDFAGTATEMLNSKWATDVGDGPGKAFDRAERLAEMMRTNRDYTR